MCSRFSIGFLDFEVVVFKKSYLLLPTISDIYKFKPTIYIKFTAEMVTYCRRQFRSKSPRFRLAINAWNNIYILTKLAPITRVNLCHSKIFCFRKKRKTNKRTITLSRYQGRINVYISIYKDDVFSLNLYVNQLDFILYIKWCLPNMFYNLAF